MESVISSLESDVDTSQELKQRKKRRKLTHETQQNHIRNGGGNRNQLVRKMRWRTDVERQIYTSKLLEAIVRAPRNSTSSSSSPSFAAAKPKEVHETADRVLAIAAKGQTRWSRAILASRVRLRVKKVKKVNVTGDYRLRRKETVISKENKREKLSAVEKRAHILSRLVPGCRKVSFANLLEEVCDYIAALEMQVKAMTALADSLSVGGGNPSPVNPPS